MTDAARGRAARPDGHPRRAVARVAAAGRRCVAAFAATVERGRLRPRPHARCSRTSAVFRRGIGEDSDVVRQGDVRVRRPRRPVPGPAARGHRARSCGPSSSTARRRRGRRGTSTPAFRYERPQAGRYRQHHQVGVEALGAGRPRPRRRGDRPGRRLLPRRSGLSRLRPCRSTRWATAPAGRPTSSALRAYLASHAEPSSATSTASGCEANPLRVLDCKRPECRAATDGGPALRRPPLRATARAHFDRVRAGLEALGIACALDHRLVRGFDYYTRTTFEFASGAIDAAQNAIGGGGRYDGLVEMLGGPPTPGIGFGIGIERVLLACDAEGVLRRRPAGARRLRGRHGRRRDGPRPDGRAAPRPACAPTGPSTAAR